MQTDITPSHCKHHQNPIITYHRQFGPGSLFDDTVYTAMTRLNGSLEKDEETNQAAWEAAKGSLVGATKWGALFAVGGGIAYAFSPFYRSLTVQFKTYIQMSGMILGGMLEADKRMIRYQHQVRYQKRLARDMEVWKRYEESYEERGTPGVGAESKVHGPDGKE
ncbi:hypothetical protein J1614_005148 [Plenodomus biglobosus]|nr:hypothetical protein J1614_005148 [Plenodomus biglobosus]